MASAMLGDVVTDVSRHPYGMVDAAHHSSDNTTSAQLNNSSYQQHRLASTSAVPTQTSSSVAHDSAARPAAQPQSTSSAIPVPQAPRQHSSSTDDPELLARGHRPPQHDFDAAQAFQQLRQAQYAGQEVDGSAPHTATAPTTAASGETHTAPQGQMSSQASQGSVPSSQHTAVPLQSAPPTSPPSPQLLPTIRSSLSMSGNTSPARIKVRDLTHIQSFASEELLTRSSRNPSTRNLRGAAGRADEGGGPPTQKYDIAQMPVTDIIEMVAGLLTKMTSTNDKAHEKDVNKHIPSLQDAAAAAAAGVNAPPAPGNSRPPTDQSGKDGYVDIRGMHRQTQSVLSFHGKNVPSISILMYLSRIHKYCPTTYEVFLSLLVYFDRMTENINKGVVHSFRNMDPEEGMIGSPPPSRSSDRRQGTHSRQASSTGEALHAGEELGAGKVGIDAKPPAMHPFVVDSFNIHRLIMAGVTCASKFFSDVFYTNSRYAKVGGLPLHELNHLELQFLLLNDFKLFIPIEELEYYGSLLVEFYAEEILAQQMKARQEREEREKNEREETSGSGSAEVSGDDDGVHMRG